MNAEVGRTRAPPAASPREEALTLAVGTRVGNVSALLLEPADARQLLVFAHGAGAGMRHPFMEAVSTRLAQRGVATLRYQFPYMEGGRKRPDPPAILLATVRAEVERAAEIAAASAVGPSLPILAGGKSMGGRMTSQAAGRGELPDVKGLVFFGFPLHAAGRPSSDRAAHLSDVTVPMLFLQGTRDSLADLDLVRSVCDALGGWARLHAVDEGDHSFHVRKSSGRTDDEVLDELADVTVEWAGGL